MAPNAHQADIRQATRNPAVLDLRIV
jgi:hypothetical protein